MKFFADTADLNEIATMSSVDGFTTNPSLMRRAGVRDYTVFAREAVTLARGRPISFEVFADDFEDMEAQAHEIASWGSNVYIKIPVTNTRGECASPLIERLSRAGILLNITALFTMRQIRIVLDHLSDTTPSILSVFAGRIADAGCDPCPIIKEAGAAIGSRSIELLWASTREPYNFVQAQQSGCHIITAPVAMLHKRQLFGKDLEQFSLETVKMFYDDATAADYQLQTRKNMKKVLITGGAGYVGTLLTQRLLDKGYSVIVYDAMFFGCKLKPHKNLQIVRADIRDTKTFAGAVQGVDAVIHLACISNDPSFHLDDQLSKTINYDCFEPLVIAAKQAGVRRFINASTSSVYGVSDQPNVTEDHPLVPLTLYNKFKGMCEPLLFKHQSKDFVCVNIRPATVCGYSPRMRLDLSVNILTNHAVNKGKITVFGGEQLRPNLHIEDMCALYELMLDAPDAKIAGETFNVGYQNHTINEIAQMVRRAVMKEYPERGDIVIEKTETNDNRSYHICSQKIFKKLGFAPKHTIEDAVHQLCQAFKRGEFENSIESDEYQNVKTLKKLGVS